jgi:hypothetical protein
MTRRMTDIDPLEISLSGAPKNRRRYLMVKGEDAPDETSGGIVFDIAEDDEGEAVENARREDEGDDDSEVTGDEGEGETNEVEDEESEDDESPEKIARKAFVVAQSRSLAIPAAVMDAMGTIIKLAGIVPSPADSTLDDETRVHVKSLIGLVGENPPEAVAKSVVTIEQWLEDGAKLKTAIEVPVQNSLVEDSNLQGKKPRKVVRSDRLVSEGEETAAQLFRSGASDLGREVLAFSRKVRKSLPEGGLVVISGDFERGEDDPIVSLSDVWTSPNPRVGEIVNAIVDSVSSVEKTPRDQAIEDASEVIRSFGSELLRTIESDLDQTAKFEQVQAIFNSLAVKVTPIVELSTPKSGSDHASELISSVQGEIKAIASRLSSIEATQKSLTFGRAIERTEAPPAPKNVSSRASAVPSPRPVVRSKLTVEDIVEASSARRFGRYGAR